MRDTRGALRDAWALARPFWFSEERWSARGLLAVVVLLGFGLRRLWLQLRGGARPLDPQVGRARDPNVIEGEFAVVRKSATPLPR